MTQYQCHQYSSTNRVGTRDTTEYNWTGTRSMKHKGKNHYHFIPQEGAFCKTFLCSQQRPSAPARTVHTDVSAQWTCEVLYWISSFTHFKNCISAIDTLTSMVPLQAEIKLHPSQLQKETLVCLTISAHSHQSDTYQNKEEKMDTSRSHRGMLAGTCTGNTWQITICNLPYIITFLYATVQRCALSSFIFLFVMAIRM